MQVAKDVRLTAMVLKCHKPKRKAPWLDFMLLTFQASISTSNKRIFRLHIIDIISSMDRKALLEVSLS